MHYNFKNKILLITGASRGIGLGIAKAFAKCGATLILTDVEEQFELLKAVSSKIKEEFGVEVKPLQLDITKVNEIECVMNSLEKEYCNIEILINNAGTNILNEALTLAEEEWDSILDVNLKGTFFLSKEIAKNMISNRIKGKIINIASQHGVVGNVDRAAYCASKAGIINLCRALSLEWAKYDIRVNCVSPTYVETDNNRDYLNSSKGKREYLSKIPLKKYATPEDVAEACLFLGSNSSRLITGQNIIIDGGYTCG